MAVMAYLHYLTTDASTFIYVSKKAPNVTSSFLMILSNRGNIANRKLGWEYYNKMTIFDENRSGKVVVLCQALNPSSNWPKRPKERVKMITLSDKN